MTTSHTLTTEISQLPVLLSGANTLLIQTTSAASSEYSSPSYASSICDKPTERAEASKKELKSDTSVLQPCISRCWRSSNYFLAFVAAAILLTETGLNTLFTPLVPYQLRLLGYGDVETLTGYFSSLYAGGLCIFAPIAGFLGSAFPNKRYLLFGYLALLASSMLLFLLVPSLAGMFVARCFQGMAGAGLWTTALALVADNVDPRRNGSLTSLAMLGYSVGSISSQAVGGTLYAKLGWKSLGVYGLGFIAFDMILCLLFREKYAALPPPSKVHNGDLESQADPGICVSQTLPAINRIRILFSDARYIAALGATLWYGLYLGGVLTTGLSLHLSSRYALSAQQSSYTFMALACPSILFVPLAGYVTDRLGARWVIIPCLTAFAVLLSVLMIDQLPYAGCVAVLVALGCAVSLINGPVVAYLSSVDHANGDRVGTSILFGAWNLANSLSSLLFPFVAGAILQRCGVQTGWKIVLGIVIVGAILSLAAVVVFVKVVPLQPLHLSCSSEKVQEDARGISAQLEA